MSHKRTRRHRSARRRKRPINRRKELIGLYSFFLVALIGAVAFSIFTNPRTGYRHSAAPDTIEQGVGSLSEGSSILIQLNDGISSEEANAIVLEYLDLQTGSRPSITIPSLIPNQDVNYWTMDLTYVQEAQAENQLIKQVQVHKSTGDVRCKELPDLPLTELAGRTSLQIRAD